MAVHWWRRGDASRDSGVCVALCFDVNVTWWQALKRDDRRRHNATTSLLVTRQSWSDDDPDALVPRTTISSVLLCRPLIRRLWNQCLAANCIYTWCFGFQFPLRIVSMEVTCHTTRWRSCNWRHILKFQHLLIGFKWRQQTIRASSSIFSLKRKICGPKDRPLKCMRRPLFTVAASIICTPDTWLWWL